MRFIPTSIQVIFLIPLLVVYAEPLMGTDDQIILYSCQKSLSEFEFGCDDEYWACNCEYEPLIASIISCINNHLPPNANKFKSYENFILKCQKYDDIKITHEQIQSIVKNSTDIITLPTDKNYIEISNSTLYSPILPMENDVISKFKDYRAFLGNFDLAQYFGILINFYWIGIIFIFAIFHKLKHFSIIKIFQNKLILNPIRKYFTMPILFYNHYQPYKIIWNFGTLLPTTLESIILLNYIILNIVFLFYNIEVYPDNSIFGSDTTRQFYRYIADRSGILSFAHFPILILFAGRNNLLISFSGINYSSFMIYHKWTARVMFIQGAIHSMAYGVLIQQDKMMDYYRKIKWFQSGILAFYLGIVICVIAIHYIRTRYYEFFLISHIVLAFVFLMCCFIHCIEFGWLEWIIISFAFWLTDRIIRVYRLIKFGAPRAKIEYISDETFKISVQRPENWIPFPGCYVYIHFLHFSIFWQSHPFTIVDSALKDREITIYVKSKEGLTNKVLQLIGFSQPYFMRVSLEGPYGFESPLQNYNNVLLIAGGNGIPGPFYHVIHLVKQSLLPKKRIRLIWIIRKVETLKWFQSELETCFKYSEYLEIDIYITKNFDSKMISNNMLLAKFNKFIRFHKGRIPTSKVLMDEFVNVTGSLAISTCGPPILCDDIRNFTANNLNHCQHRVDLFEELQVW
ncbi:hypothetical protein WICMUC_004317 [Wickerhamomyces mucosus]|uniref:ferric-chelate reductase (NADPH) n=1 Tax=Wickerhamomyces mucosus TaxID=1378264 RepID=A0A9P8PIN7_9ASCO|nr:hypothetical protein WICMUC_004317 [Wickerhamomyces mucosus]